MSLTRPSGIVLVLTLGISLLVLLVSLATGRTSAQTPGDDARRTELDRVEKALNHFKCWTIPEAASVNRTVFLHDQFDFETNAAGQREPTFETVRVQNPTVFCNATRKIHPLDDGQVITAGINDVNDHLTCYNMETLEDFEVRFVDVLNQFGSDRLEVLDPIGLCAPTQKLQVNENRPEFGGEFPKNLDHFKCYEVLPVAPLDETVQLQDQFDRLFFGPNYMENALVLEPAMLCNPTRKARFLGFTSAALTSSSVKFEAVGVKHPAAHLVCYRIQSPETISAALVIRNQFGTQQFPVFTPEMLCVPSLKREVRTGG